MASLATVILGIVLIVLGWGGTRMPSMTTWENIIYNFGPPLFMGILVIVINRRLKAGDRLRLKARQEDEEKRQEMVRLLQEIRTQSSWIVRKFVELGTVHNTRHPETRVRIDDYPDGVVRLSQGSQYSEGE